MVFSWSGRRETLRVPVPQHGRFRGESETILRIIHDAPRWCAISARLSKPRNLSLSANDVLEQHGAFLIDAAMFLHSTAGAGAAFFYFAADSPVSLMTASNAG